MRECRSIVGTLLAAVLLVAGCGSGAGQARPGESTPSGSRPQGTGGREQPGPGDHELTLNVQGQPWPYLVHAPRSYDGSKPTPVVLALHGRPSSPEAVRRLSGLDDKADDAGFLAVFPRGEGRAWNPTRGSAGGTFLRSLILHLQRVWKADPERIYIAGFSNGGAMALQAAAELVDLVAAVAPVSPGDAAPDLSALANRRAPALIGFYGERDRSNPFTLLSSWHEATGCGDPKVSTVKGGVSREASTCRGGAPTVVLVLRDMAHDWPGGSVGEAFADDSPISATDVMWDFFAKNPRKE